MTECSDTPSQAVPGTLHILCGKIASGKSTLAAQLADHAGNIILSEDRWLSALFRESMNSVEDYIHYSGRLKEAITPHIIALLQAGVTVVLDFPANTLASREWIMSIIKTSGARHQLHYLAVSDEVCKARLRKRNAAGEHDFAATEAQFDFITAYFVEPQPEEGFVVVRH
ncbi:ATP-binding protein [uncultured Cedecea sp.]|uniref:AAA family ATPase n=1 Tax=uncultured Cedecea sp. TaxID=988762 RepID=UPI00260708DF|nr:ATP-binding protein [uncultured Cedecea sp.]